VSGEVTVGHVVTGFVVIGANERPNDSHAAERFAHDLLDPVGPFLHGPEEGHGSGRDDAHYEGHERHDPR